MSAPRLCVKTPERPFRARPTENAEHKITSHSILCQLSAVGGAMSVPPPAVTLSGCVQRDGASVRSCVRDAGVAVGTRRLGASTSGEQVHVLGCEVSEEEFREGFDSDINSRLVYHDLFKDPLSWSNTGDAVLGGPLGALKALGKRTDPRPVTIALDSLSWLLLRLPCTTLCQTLRALSCPDVHLGDSSLVEQVHVLGLVHEELHGPGLMGALNSLAHTEVTLGGKMGQTSAHIFYRRPQQHAAYQTWWFSILPDFSLELQEEPPFHLQPHPGPHTAQVDPMTHLTFNLRLSKKEREARDSLTLPFQFSSEKQQALLCPGPGLATSHIFYEPDAFDDLDHEDPDDDLDI